MYKTCHRDFWVLLCLLTMTMLLVSLPVQASDQGSGQASDEMLAMVTDISGSVNVIHQYGENQLDLLAKLFDQDQLTLVEGARVVIVHLTNSQEYEIKGPSTYRVTENGLKHLEGGQAREYNVLTGNAVATDTIRSGNIAYAGLALKGNDQGSSQTTRVKTLRGGKTFNPYPWFKWQSVSPGKQYQLVLKNAAGKVVWKTSTSASAIKLPANIFLKRGQKYTWTLATGNSDQVLTNTFSMATIKEEKQVRKILEDSNHKFADRVLKATLLESMQFVDDANVLWQKLYRERPDNKTLKLKMQAI